MHANMSNTVFLNHVDNGRKKKKFKNFKDRISCEYLGKFI